MSKLNDVLLRGVFGSQKKKEISLFYLRIRTMSERRRRKSFIGVDLA